MHAPPGATAYLFGPDTFVSKTVDSLGSQLFRNVKSGAGTASGSSAAA